jgi:hypothetical protein
LSISGNVLAVGTLNFVIVYERNTTDGSWAQTITLTSPIGSTSDHFGYCVSVDGDVMIVGAPNSYSQKGAAYVYEKNQTTWELTTYLTADDGSSRDYFGLSVGVADGTIVVGAYGDASYTRSVYTFQKHAGIWMNMTKITADDGESNDHFG